jgi:multiple inositol-polyphosphate phosphatase/2,3-bisphosphoglycerate 3-phosphatase
MSEDRDKLGNEELESDNDDNDVEAHQLGGDRDQLGGDRDQLGGDRDQLGGDRDAANDA